jgi:hypothetical protein
LDVLAITACYLIVFAPEHWSINWAKFAMVLYVTFECAGAMLVGGMLLLIKCARYFHEKVEIQYDEEKIKLDEEQYGKIFDGFFRQLTVANSKLIFIVSLIVDVLVFVGLVTAGWFFSSILHVVSNLLMQKIKFSLFPMVVENLKSRVATETNETIDELADKLFNG